jgi:hypothetical protein
MTRNTFLDVKETVNERSIPRLLQNLNTIDQMIEMEESFGAIKTAVG